MKENDININITTTKKKIGWYREFTSKKKKKLHPPPPPPTGNGIDLRQLHQTRSEQNADFVAVVFWEECNRENYDEEY